MDDKDISEELKNVFDNVNHWLSFAEAKNAGLMAINIALLSVVIKAFKYNLFLGLLSTSGILMSFLINIISLLSKIDMKIAKESITEEDNLLFWKDISKYDYKIYLQTFYYRYCNVTEGLDIFSAYNLDISREIVENSRITYEKYRLFNIAVRIDIVSIIINFVIFIIIA